MNDSSNIIPFQIKVDTLICGNCHDDDGIFHIGKDFVAFCVVCTWTVKLESSSYPDWRNKDE